MGVSSNIRPYVKLFERVFKTSKKMDFQIEIKRTDEFCESLW